MKWLFFGKLLHRSSWCTIELETCLAFVTRNFFCSAHTASSIRSHNDDDFDADAERRNGWSNPFSRYFYHCLKTTVVHKCKTQHTMKAPQTYLKHNTFIWNTTHRLNSLKFHTRKTMCFILRLRVIRSAEILLAPSLRSIVYCASDKCIVFSVCVLCFRHVCGAFTVCVVQLAQFKSFSPKPVIMPPLWSHLRSNLVPWCTEALEKLCENRIDIN